MAQNQGEKVNVDALRAAAVPFSSVVGSGIVFTTPEGPVVIQLAVMVPSPQFDYRSNAEPFVARLVDLWNRNSK